MEMVDSLDELKSTRSVNGEDFPNIEMPDAKIDCSEQDDPEFPVREEGQLRSRKPRKRTGFCEEDRFAFMIFDYFRVTGAHDTVLDYP